MDKITRINPQSIQPQAMQSIPNAQLIEAIAQNLVQRQPESRSQPIHQSEQHVHYHVTIQPPEQSSNPTQEEQNIRVLLHALAGLAIVLLFFFGAMSITVLIWQGVHASTQYQTGGH